MITHKAGDIFTTTLNAIGHGVNCRGKMGSGIAVDVRINYPDVYQAYKITPLVGGDLFVKQSNVDGRYIFNLASQEEEGRSATYPFLEASLHKALQYCGDNDLTSLALPQIGCGVGGLEWGKVLPMIETIASEYPDVEIELWTYVKPKSS